MQTKKKRNIEVKYPSSPYSIHYTNSIGYINSIMTLKYYPYSLQHILPPLEKP